jgi:hypothetical protein
MNNPGRPGASLLLTDLDLANTFLNIAGTCGLKHMRKRNITNAWKAHDAVTRVATRAGLTDPELLTIRAGLHELRKRLGEIESYRAVNQQSTAARR